MEAGVLPVRSGGYRSFMPGGPMGFHFASVYKIKMPI